ncbi:hypothetical protein PQR14_27560 [Paraburkholderia bryophila]|uniref:hypothetical protein n=1 Tax=Paraburkholderia bryophila TaxID=420952 RepID=UPI0038B6E322
MMPSNKDSSEQVPASSWNYRVVEFSNEFGETFRAIHEVYYSNGVPNGYAQDAAAIQWDTDEGDEGALRVLQRMREALAKPVLTEKDFGKNSPTI